MYKEISIRDVSEQEASVMSGGDEDAADILTAASAGDRALHLVNISKWNGQPDEVTDLEFTH